MSDPGNQVKEIFYQQGQDGIKQYTKILRCNYFESRALVEFSQPSNFVI